MIGSECWIPTILSPEAKEKAVEYGKHRLMLGERNGRKHREYADGNFKLSGNIANVAAQMASAWWRKLKYIYVPNLNYNMTPLFRRKEVKCFISSTHLCYLNAKISLTQNRKLFVYDWEIKHHPYRIRVYNYVIRNPINEASLPELVITLGWKTFKGIKRDGEHKPDYKDKMRWEIAPEKLNPISKDGKLLTLKKYKDSKYEKENVECWKEYPDWVKELLINPSLFFKLSEDKLEELFTIFPPCNPIKKIKKGP